MNLPLIFAGEEIQVCGPFVSWCGVDICMCKKKEVVTTVVTVQQPTVLENTTLVSNDTVISPNGLVCSNANSNDLAAYQRGLNAGANIYQRGVQMGMQAALAQSPQQFYHPHFPPYAQFGFNYRNPFAYAGFAHPPYALPYAAPYMPLALSAMPSPPVMAFHPPVIPVQVAPQPVVVNNYIAQPLPMAVPAGMYRY